MTKPRFLDARYFPNLSPRALYSPHDLAVHMRTEVFEPERERDDEYRRSWIASRLPLLVHEYQHSIDHLGTVVGRQLLDALMRALDGLAGKFENDVTGLPATLAYHDKQRRFYRSDYFTEIRKGYRPRGGGRPRWSWGTSIGAGFDMTGNIDESEPILFARFTDEDQKVLVSRQPLTSAALFETRAVYAELDHDARAVAAQGEESPEWKKFNDRQQEMFYDHTLTIYSAPAHLVSSHCAASDPIDAYRLAAKAANIALNFTVDLPIDSDLPKRFAPEAMQRAAQLQAMLDPGYLFAAIVLAAPRFEGDDDAWLAEGLTKAGMPPADEILDAAESYLQTPTLTQAPRLFEIYMTCVVNGVGNFKRLRKSGGILDFDHMRNLGTPQGPMALPNVFLANDVLSSSRLPILEMEQQETMVIASTELHQHLEEFVRACR